MEILALPTIQSEDDRVGICHKCQYAERPCYGPCACRIDGLDLTLHAKSGKCPMGQYQPTAIDPTLSIEETIRAIEPGRVVRDRSIDALYGGPWWTWPTVQEAHRRMMKSAADRIVLQNLLSSTPDTSPPSTPARGIVIAAGGIYFDSAYVTLRVLRHLGCTLPVEFWHLGPQEMMPWQAASIDPFNAVAIDAWQVRRQHPARLLHGGWELKVYAMLHCPFDQVLYLDADCYPARDPTFLFDAPEFVRTGALFWPTPRVFDTPRSSFDAVGVDPLDTRPFETGQILLNKLRCRNALELAWWMNDHSDYYYELWHGDTATFRVAWLYFNQPYGMTPWDFDIEQPAHVQYGFEDPKRPLFVHRAAGKFTLDDPRVFTTLLQQPPMRNRALPMEQEAWGFLDDLRKVRELVGSAADGGGCCG